MQNYQGTIIEESLEDKSVLKDIKILSTKVEKVTARHATPWLKKWTLHKVEIPEDQAVLIAEIISENLDKDHAWYADYKNDDHHYIIFRGKIFFMDRKNQMQYDEAKNYGLSLGIPSYQVDFQAKMVK